MDGRENGMMASSWRVGAEAGGWKGARGEMGGCWREQEMDARCSEGLTPCGGAGRGRDADGDGAEDGMVLALGAGSASIDGCWGEGGEKEGREGPWRGGGGMGRRGASRADEGGGLGRREGSWGAGQGASMGGGNGSWDESLRGGGVNGGGEG